MSVTVMALGPHSLLQGAARLDRTQFGINYNSNTFQNLDSYAIRNEFQLAFRLKAGRR